MIPSLTVSLKGRGYKVLPVSWGLGEKETCDNKSISQYLNYTG